MKQVSRVMWTLSLGLIMILSSTVMNVNSGTVSDAGIAAAPPQPTVLVDYNPWPTYNGTTVYHSFAEMETELFWIADNYPQITKLVSIGKSWQGRDIWAMKVSDNPHVEEDEPEVYFNSNHHAREWMTIEITLYLLRYLTNFYGTNATITELVDTRQIWVIPTANPDGRYHDSAGDDPAVHALGSWYNDTVYGWRKNMRENGVAGFQNWYDGVDLNRNYGYLWGSAGATSYPGGDTYGGPYPFSEPETAAIRDFCRQHDFVFAISYHTYSQLILYPWGWSFENAPDNDALIAVGNQMRSRITNTAGSQFPGYTVQKSSGLYPTAGSDDDWLYGELGVFAYCIEAYPSVQDDDSSAYASYAAVSGSYDLFHPRSDKVLPVCQDNLPAALMICLASSNRYQFTDHVSIEPETAEMTVEDSTTGHFTLTVTDDGQRADVFDLTNTGVAGWAINLDQTTLNLAKDGTRDVDLGITVPFGETPGTYSFWVNITSQTNSSCRDSMLMSVTVPYPYDVSPLTLEPFTEMGDFPKGQYRIDSEIGNVGESAVPEFNTTLTIKQIGVGSTVTLFQDDFEAILPNAKWSIIDHDTTYSLSVWQRSGVQKHGGLYSAWCGSGSYYTLNTIQSLQMAQPISLARYTSATLQFWNYYVTEAYYDFLMVEGSPDNGQSWDYIARYDGSSLWAQRTLNLSTFLGAEQFKLRLRFTSDDWNPSNMVGVYVDDLIITAVNPTESTIHTATLSTSGSLGIDEAETLSWTYDFDTPGTYLASVETKYPLDSNMANNVTDVMFLIDDRDLPVFAGLKSVEDSGGGTILAVSWEPALQVNDPIQYNLYRFDHSPSEAEVNASAPVWTGTTVGTVDSGLTPGNTYYYVVRAMDDLGQKEYNLVVRSATTTITNPLFDGVEMIFDSGTGTDLDVVWQPAFDIDWPISYNVFKFDHSPTNGEIDAATAIGTTTALSYHDSGLTSGNQYWYAVRAEDAAGNGEYNYVSSSGTPSSRWYLQLDGAINSDQMDGGGGASTQEIDSTGQYRVGETWASDIFVQSMDIAGPWTFQAYGSSLSANGDGYLYAKIFRTSNSQLLSVTPQDDENVKDFPETHLFTWTATMPSEVIAADDSVTVEIWLNVSYILSGIGGGTEIYNYVGINRTIGPHDAQFCAVDAASTAEFDTPNVEAATIRLTDLQFGQVNASDNILAVSGNPGSGDEMFLKCTMYCPVTTAYITNLAFRFVGRTPTLYASNYQIYSRNMIGNSWMAVGSTASVAANSNVDITRSVANGFSDYISGSWLRWGVYQSYSSYSMTVDYVEAAITWYVAPVQFNLELDDFHAPSGIIPTLTPTGIIPYDIDLSGRTTGDWVFVSFPVQASGHIESVLNDTTLGDGQTSWDVAKAWDNLNKRWLTYRKSGTQTFTQVNNQMGAWLHLTGNDGDQNLTLGVAGNYPSSAVEIQLYAGWNMVGYPSAAGSATLPAEAAMISEWQSASPYIVDKAPGEVTMSQGNGYWIKVTIDCIWNVQP